MRASLGCTLLSVALAGCLALPAQAVGTSDGPGTRPTVVVAQSTRTLTPAAAAAQRPALAVGSRSPAVTYLQRVLGVRPTSGYYGPLTRRAVRGLQRTYGLKVTGRVTRATWTVLLGPVATRPKPAAPKPATPTPTTAAGAPATPRAPTPEQAAAARPLLRPGTGPGNPAVVFVQRYLRVSPATGYFGTLTTAAVRAYQQGLGIPATGNVGPLTWAAIHAGRVVTAPAGPTATPAPPTSPTSTGPTGPTATPAPPTPAPPTIPTPTYVLPADPEPREVALVFALAQVGKPYVLGGNGPAVFDCSGLVQQAYLLAGLRLPRLASQQRFAGTKVPREALLPGDLVYYQDGTSPRQGHISMYAGDGLVVEAANPRRGVRIRTLDEPWYRDRFVAAVRIG